MFLAWCDTKGRNVLIGATYIEGLTNTELGIIVTYQCECGETGQIISGSAVEQRSGHTTPSTPASEAPTAA